MKISGMISGYLVFGCLFNVLDTFLQLKTRCKRCWVKKVSRNLTEIYKTFYDNLKIILNLHEAIFKPVQFLCESWICSVSWSVCLWLAFPAYSDVTLQLIEPIRTLGRKWSVVNAPPRPLTATNSLKTEWPVLQTLLQL